MMILAAGELFSLTDIIAMLAGGGVVTGCILLVFFLHIRAKKLDEDLSRDLFGDRFCPCCRYDLRGHAHARCPECGEVIDQPATKSALPGDTIRRDG